MTFDSPSRQRPVGDARKLGSLRVLFRQSDHFIAAYKFSQNGGRTRLIIGDKHAHESLAELSCQSCARCELQLRFHSSALQLLRHGNGLPEPSIFRYRARRSSIATLHVATGARSRGAAGKFDETQYLTGDWGGLREPLLDSGVEVFAFYNSIVSGNVSGGKHPHNATIVDDAWVGLIRSREAGRMEGRPVRCRGSKSRWRRSHPQIYRQYLHGAANGGRPASVSLSTISAAEILGR